MTSIRRSVDIGRGQKFMESSKCRVQKGPPGNRVRFAHHCNKGTFYEIPRTSAGVGVHGIARGNLSPRGPWASCIIFQEQERCRVRGFLRFLGTRKCWDKRNCSEDSYLAFPSLRLLCSVFLLTPALPRRPVPLAARIFTFALHLMETCPRLNIPCTYSTCSTCISLYLHVHAFSTSLVSRTYSYVNVLLFILCRAWISSRGPRESAANENNVQRPTKRGEFL